jgi:hypothetical protein
MTRHGKPAGVLVGFETEDDWFDYRLEKDPEFLRRIEGARQSIRAGDGVRLEDVQVRVWATVEADMIARATRYDGMAFVA